MMELQSAQKTNSPSADLTPAEPILNVIVEGCEMAVRLVAETQTPRWNTVCVCACTWKPLNVTPEKSNLKHLIPRYCTVDIRWNRDKVTAVTAQMSVMVLMGVLALALKLWNLIKPMQGVQRTSCSYLLCTILLFVAVLLAVTVTGTILLMNHSQAPSGPDAPPLITTNQDEGNALVTVERGDGSRINIFIDPNCPDYNSNFLRLEGLQTSLLHSLSHHDTDLKSVKGQERALLVQLAEEIAKLSAHGSQLKAEYTALRQGQSSISQEISMLQTEQARLIQKILSILVNILATLLCQLLSESQNNMMKVVNTVSDVFDSMQKEPGSMKVFLKADLQRAPVRSGVRPRGCSSGEGRPRDCSDIYASGQREDGIYSIFPIHFPSGFQVYCDMSTEGGGWTPFHKSGLAYVAKQCNLLLKLIGTEGLVFQRREDGSVNFYRDWAAYQEGFGKITGEHWLVKPFTDEAIILADKCKSFWSGCFSFLLSS
ncbi:hypothetical protein QTP70_011103 [Hemibagrus guttatus]|uniref:Fibrinogen C-terminal domain-containing protein n=1 Tax=Hemibagrus guttatus TaxID=175788 RepID=A0AAE0V7R0_9TELE|nr:hypothetical protein QTP70_011103 [Hemibagrus guttatus]